MAIYKGTPDDDLLDGTTYSYPEFIYGLEGNDTLIAAFGTRKLSGGSGADNISGANAFLSVTILGGQGDDKIEGSYRSQDTIYGGLGNDFINANRGSDFISGDEGNDKINGGEGNDTILGKDGDDRADGGSGNDSVFGHDGKDDLYGNSGDDLISGGLGNDSLRGDGGSDTFIGGAGDDYIYAIDSGVSATTHLDSLDIVKYLGRFENFIITAPQRGSLVNFQIQDTVGGEGTDYVRSPDILEFSGTNYYWNGQQWTPVQMTTTGNDKVFLQAGDNYLYGYAGDDQIYGNIGDDTIDGASGNNQLFGGEGDDKIFGERGNDRMHGDGGDDYFDGNGGNDTIRGGEGNDQIYLAASTRTGSYGLGENGNDYVRGGALVGTDTIRGGDGNDTILGDGNAYMAGDAGNDMFIIHNQTNAHYFISDFTQGEDVLNLRYSNYFNDFEDIMTAVSTNERGDVVIMDPSITRQVITMHNVKIEDLDASDFTFIY